MRAETFERDRGIANSLAAEADTDGVVVYGSPKGSPSMKTADPRARWQVVEDWLAVPEEDRRVATACLAIDPPMRGAAAFHCQQSAEKLLKGFLTLAAKRSRKTHSLTELGTAAEASFPEIADLVATAKGWSNWAFEFRYPPRRGRAKPLPDEEELRRALGVIDDHQEIDIAVTGGLAARPRAEQDHALRLKVVDERVEQRPGNNRPLHRCILNLLASQANAGAARCPHGAGPLATAGDRA